MPIKKDETGKRWVEMEFVAPGTPEQLWQAMATGPGNTAWFTKATVDERVGGEIQFDFGTRGTQSGEVTAWEPPHRFAYVERHWSEGAPPVATEITITARSGDTCVVRMVHSLFTSSDEWDDQIEGFEKGWPAFFAVLRLYLTHFPGQRAASFATDESRSTAIICQRGRASQRSSISPARAWARRGRRRPNRRRSRASSSVSIRIGSSATS